MIHIAICDDEPAVLALLRGRLDELLSGRNAQLETFLSGTALRDAIVAGSRFDAIFLDINFPDINGILLARQLRPLIEDSLLIFVSSQDDAVYASFAASPFRFLRKSRLDEELPQIVRDLLAQLKKQAPTSIVLQYRQAQITVNPLKVLYIESNLKTQVIHLPERNLEINVRLKDLEPQFLPFGFLKPHNSYLVNYRYIASINKSELRLDNGELLPISRHRLKAFKEEYLEHISAL